MIIKFVTFCLTFLGFMCLFEFGTYSVSHKERTIFDNAGEVMHGNVSGDNSSLSRAKLGRFPDP